VAFTGLLLLAPVLLRAYPHDVRLFRLAALTVPVGLVIDVMGGVVLGERRYGLTYLYAVGGAIGRATILVVLAIAGSLTVQSAVWATALMSLIGLPIFLRVFAWRPDAAPPATVPVTRTLGSYGLRSWGIATAGLANSRLDQVLMLPVAGAVQLGYYAVAVSLAELTTPITGAIAQVLFPEAAARRSWVSVAQAVRGTVIVVGSLSLGGIAIAPLVIPLAFGHDFSDAVPMAQVLFVAGVPLALRLLLGAGFLAAGRPGLSSKSQIVALCVTAAGLAALVPAYGAIGAAYTSLAAYSTACAFSAWQARRLTGMSYVTLLVPHWSDVRWLATQLRHVAPKVGHGRWNRSS
jgi:O-antigen/teichoic acid export membrane protein